MTTARRLRNEEGWSNRKLAGMFGGAHTTIARVLEDSG
jgi:transcriptional regulator with XRE-family HTH domain